MAREAYPPPFLIAEIGCNHCGDFEHAKELVRMAADFCKVPCVKFQKRDVREVLSEEEYNAPHPNPGNSYGSTYGEHRNSLEFTIDQHAELKDFCDSLGILYSCSIWDMTSAAEIAALKPALIKIPSACNTHFDMAGYLCEHYPGEIHVSLGMTRPREIDALVEFHEARGRAQDLVIYHCTSGYPVKFEDTCLLEIPRLREQYGERVKAIGFSGHHLGFAIDLCAYALGASHFERHFTLDRTQKGTDHAASLEPDGMRRLWRNLDAACLSMRPKPADILEVEEPQRKKLKWDRNQKNS